MDLLTKSIQGTLPSSAAAAHGPWPGPAAPASDVLVQGDVRGCPGSRA